jgi:hypothetical protein
MEEANTPPILPKPLAARQKSVASPRDAKGHPRSDWPGKKAERSGHGGRLAGGGARQRSGAAEPQAVGTSGEKGEGLEGKLTGGSAQRMVAGFDEDIDRWLCLIDGDGEVAHHWSSRCRAGPGEVALRSIGGPRLRRWGIAAAESQAMRPSAGAPRIRRGGDGRGRAERGGPPPEPVCVPRLLGTDCWRR